MVDEYKQLHETLKNEDDDSDNMQSNDHHTRPCYRCCTQRYLQITITVTICLAGCLLLVFLFREFLSNLLTWMENLPPWQGAIIFVLLATLVSFPMTWGLIILNLAAGFLYGALLGFFVIFVASVFGVIVSVVLCRRFCRRYFRRKIAGDKGYLRALMSLVEGPNGYRVIALSRLTPMPYGFQNGLFAVTDAGITRIVLATMMGNMPLILVNAYIGSKLRTMEDVTDSKRVENYAIIGLQILVSIALMIYVVRRSRLEINKALRNLENKRSKNQRTVGARLLSHTDVIYVESRQVDQESSSDGSNVRTVIERDHDK